MSRAQTYLALIDDPSLPALTDRHPHDAPLLAMMVHLCFSDGLVQDDELALLERMRPSASTEELLGWVNTVSQEVMDWNILGATSTTPAERLACQRLATRMACMDGEITDEEQAALLTIEGILELIPGTYRACIDEVLAICGEIDEERVRRALMSMQWRELYPERGALGGPLAAVVPTGATALCTMEGRNGEEVAGLYVEGLATRFSSGPNFLRWTDVAQYTRCPVLGANAHIMTRTGFKLTLGVDSALKDLGQLLDLISGHAPLQER